jgi:hypothetical protein
VPQWTLVAPDTEGKGVLNVMVDHRHGFRDITPADLAAEAGYIGLTGLFYSDIGLALINLNWAQALNGGKSKLVICRYDPSEHPMTKSAFFAATAAFVIAAAPVTAGETMTVGWSQLPNAGVRKELEGRSANLEAGPSGKRDRP